MISSLAKESFGKLKGMAVIGTFFFLFMVAFSSDAFSQTPNFKHNYVDSNVALDRLVNTLQVMADRGIDVGGSVTKDQYYRDQAKYTIMKNVYRMITGGTDTYSALVRNYPTNPQAPGNFSAGNSSIYTNLTQSQLASVMQEVIDLLKA